MTLYDRWANSRNPRQASVARGGELFNTKRIDIIGVAGLNDDLNLPTIAGSCTSCHDTPNVGNHSAALPIDIGLTDPAFRTDDLPLYTLKNKTTGEIRKTSDPGRAMITGLWKDIGKFKGPVLRGLAARARTFTTVMPRTWGKSWISTRPASRSNSLSRNAKTSSPFSNPCKHRHTPKMLVNVARYANSGHRAEQIGTAAARPRSIDHRHNHPGAEVE